MGRISNCATFILSRLKYGSVGLLCFVRSENDFMCTMIKDKVIISAQVTYYIDHSAVIYVCQ